MTEFQHVKDFSVSDHVLRNTAGSWLASPPPTRGTSLETWVPGSLHKGVRGSPVRARDSTKVFLSSSPNASGPKNTKHPPLELQRAFQLDIARIRRATPSHKHKASGRREEGIRMGVGEREEGEGEEGAKRPAPNIDKFNR